MTSVHSDRSFPDTLAAARAIDQPAFITLFDETRLAELAGRAGDGPLSGVAFAVKDNIDVAGVATTVGCPTRTAPADRDATVVRRLMDAGAVPIGKTNMDQFATGLVGTRSPYGACHSVASAAHVSGGSSSGSAVAVADGVVPLALGTDTAGSGRVPAAFNGIVGVKPTKGLLSNAGVFPASPSLDCVSTFTRTVAAARVALEAMAGVDAADPYSRAAPVPAAPGVARRMRVLAVPDAPLDLDEAHQEAWQAALEHAAGVARIVRVDISAFLEASTLLYGGPFVAERLVSFGALLEPDGPHLDPTVRTIVLGARSLTAEAAFAGIDRLTRLRARAMRAFEGADALLLPVTPGHPTQAEIAADPIGANAPLGTYTNMVNLLDQCAVAVPAGRRRDGLPFGVQLVAPAFADGPLLDLAGRWCGEPVPDIAVPAHRTLLAVGGAHLSGQPRNGELVELGGRLHSRVRTGPGYRMYRVPGPFPRAGLVRGGGPDDGIELELWDVPREGLDRLRPTIAAPLGLGPVTLDDGTPVNGFVADAADVTASDDITRFGSWRAYLDATLAHRA